MEGETLITELFTPPQNSDGAEEIDIISNEELEQLITERDPKYTDSEVLGQGGVGTVYETVDTSLKRTVALKVLGPKLKNSRAHVTQFLKEAQLTACICHPNIIPIHELGYDCDMGIYYTMKKIDGEDLHQILTKVSAKDKEYVKKYTRRRLLQIFIQACQGIAYAHSKGLIHRDIKPENIIIGEYGEVFVIDWGLVKNVDEKSDTAAISQTINDALDTQTMVGQVSGTPMYLAPEQITGNVSYSSDVYSLGATLYTILTLKLPFSANSDVMVTLKKVYKGDFIRPRKKSPQQKIPHELEAICLKAMEHDVEDRYSNVLDLIHDITNYWDHGSIIAYCAPPHIKFLKLLKRHPLVSTTIAASLIGAITVTTAIWGINYNRAMRFYEIALHNKELADSYLDEAIELNKQTETQAKNSNYCRYMSDEEKMLQSQLQRAASTADNRFQIALDNFNKIGRRFRPEEVNEQVKAIFKRKAEFTLATNQFRRLKKWHAMAQNWIKMSRVKLSPAEKGRLAVIQKVMAGVGNVTFTLPDDTTAMLSIRRLNPHKTRSMPKRVIKPTRIHGKETFELDRGSYIATIRMRGTTPFSYPFHLNHSDKKSISLAPPPKVPKGMRFIPAGNTIIGGRHSLTLREHRQYLPAFFLKSTEVTIEEYIKFAKTFTDEQKKNFYPFISDQQDRCKRINVWDDNFTILPPYKAKQPITGITLEAAQAYCVWKTKTTGLPHRLPTAVEWEKAARGADGRQFSWGNRYEKGQANILEPGQKPSAAAAKVGSYNTDRSIYGILDLMGNVKEMTISTFHHEAGFFQTKGSSYRSYARNAFAATSAEYIGPAADLGFRYVIERPQNEQKK